MMITRKPIKRSKELTPLSREHHEGLLFTWKIKQGLENKIDPKRIASFCWWFWQQHLKGHTEKEERILTDVLSFEHPAMVKMLDEHEAIEAIILALQQYASYERLQRLMTILNYHIRFEERQLFTLVEQIATEEQLKKIASDLGQEEGSAGQWVDEFWVKTKATNEQ